MLRRSPRTQCPGREVRLHHSARPGYIQHRLLQKDAQSTSLGLGAGATMQKKKSMLGMVGQLLQPLNHWFFAWETNETSEKDFDLGCMVWEKITGQTCSQADSRHKNPTQTACQFFQPSIHSSYILQLLQLRAKQPLGTRQKCEFPMRKL